MYYYYYHKTCTKNSASYHACYLFMQWHNRVIIILIILYATYSQHPFHRQNQSGQCRRNRSNWLHGSARHSPPLPHDHGSNCQADQLSISWNGGSTNMTVMQTALEM